MSKLNEYLNEKKETLRRVAEIKKSLHNAEMFEFEKLKYKLEKMAIESNEDEIKEMISSDKIDDVEKIFIALVRATKK